MHILHIIQLYHPVQSGAARYFAEISRRLVADGHRVTALTTDAYDLEHFWMAGRRRIEQPEEVYQGVRIVRLPVRRIPGPPLLYPALRRVMAELSRIPGSAPLLRRLACLTPQLPALKAFLAQAGPFDLVHTGNITLDFAIVPALAYAKQQGLPFVCTPFVHLGEPGNNSLLRYYSMRHHIALLKESDRVLTMTGLEADALAARGIARERLKRVGAGITPAEIQGGDGARFRSEHTVTGPFVLYIGALAHDKGAVHVVQAMQRLWSQGSNATLVMIGAPLAHFTHFYEQLPEEARARIRLLPYATDQVKKDALAAATLFTMPSRTDSFGIVYLEAWCYRLPVIGARAGGVPDVITGGEDGLLVGFGDIKALAGAIQQLLSDQELASHMGEAGYAKVLREMTWERTYQAVRDVYAELENKEQRTENKGTREPGNKRTR